MQLPGQAGPLGLVAKQAERALGLSPRGFQQEQVKNEGRDRLIMGFSTP